MADRVPFTLLGGYLGAGKTTLLNRLLTGGSPGGLRIAVLVNDVGAINVDAALIAEHDGPTLSLTNGCVCCAITDDLTTMLEELRGWLPRPDHVVMELSGVAEPARLAAWADTTGFRLDGIVVAADADQIVEMSMRRFVGDTVRVQLSAADLVVLTKTDVADDVEGARRFVAGVTSAPVFDGVLLDPAMLFGLDRMPVGRAVAGVADADAGSAVERYRTETVGVSGLTRADLVELVNELGTDVVRAKGLVRCSDVDTAVEVQVVGRRRAVRVRPDRVDGADELVVIRAS